jgi:type I restriction enzyme M protein
MDISSMNALPTHRRYLGAAAVEDDGAPFAERFAELEVKLDEQLEEGKALGALIQAGAVGVVVDG